MKKPNDVPGEEDLTAALQDLFTHPGEPSPSEYTRRRQNSLEVIRRWLESELTWMRHESVAGQPWEVVYRSIGDDGQGRSSNTFPTKEAAQAEVKRSNPTASFGWYEARPIKKPFSDE